MGDSEKAFRRQWRQNEWEATGNTVKRMDRVVLAVVFVAI